MILAAGLGKRMRPLTAIVPKPLIKVNGKALIDHALDRLATFGIKNTVVNVHYIADLMEAHLHQRKAPSITISDERSMLLETGGGVKKALNKLGKEPFFLMNSDSFWIEGVTSNLELLSKHWNAKDMDMLLLVAAATSSVGLPGRGDFLMQADGQLHRRPERQVAPFNYTGTAIISPHIFADTPDGSFSMNYLFDRAIKNNRLFGIRLDGLWLHVGTPEAIQEAEHFIRESAA